MKWWVVAIKSSFHTNGEDRSLMGGFKALEFHHGPISGKHSFHREN